MNHSQIAEAWRKQEKKKATGHNVYFEGKTIYSYGSHFPMAYITNFTLENKTIVLVNGSTYSVSTSKHQSYVSHQLYNDLRVEVSTSTLKNMIDCLEYNNGITKQIMDTAKEELIEKINALYKKEARAWKHKERYFIESEAIQEQLVVLQTLPIKEFPVMEYPF